MRLLRQALAALALAYLVLLLHAVTFRADLDEAWRLERARPIVRKVTTIAVPPAIPVPWPGLDR